MSVDVGTSELGTLFEDLQALVLIGKIKTEHLSWFLSLDSDRLKMLMEQDESKPVRVSSILRRISDPLIIPATDGTEIILNATDVFAGFIDRDFRIWGLNETSGPTPERPVVVHEMVEDATFEQLFGSFSVDMAKLCLTQSQIIRFVKTHPEHLRTNRHATLFLFKSEGKFFVAHVNFGDNDLLEVFGVQFEDDSVWHAEFRHRIVVPQL